MRAVFLILALFFTTACAAPSGSEATNSKKAETYGAKDHIPPPPFKDDDDINVGQACGGMMANAGNDCPQPGTYCHVKMKDRCGIIDAPGQCRVMPQACPQDVDPVCGCDGQTYSNECAANQAGVSAAQRGKCPA